MEEKLQKFCARHNAYGLTPRFAWHGYHVFEVESERDAIMPRFIFVKDGEARWSDSSETLDLLMEESESDGCECK